MKKNQVSVADNPQAHTVKFVDAKDLIIGTNEKGQPIKLGCFLNAMNKRINDLEAENKTLKKALGKTLEVSALINNK